MNEWEFGDNRPATAVVESSSPLLLYITGINLIQQENKMHDLYIDTADLSSYTFTNAVWMHTIIVYNNK